jgi:hypothetical protein
MSPREDKNTAKFILDAIHAKRERKKGDFGDTSAIEASLIADIDAFDLEGAALRARREYEATSGAGLHDASLNFPEILPAGTVSPKDRQKPTVAPGPTPEAVAHAQTGMLARLREQAERRQIELHGQFAQRTVANEAIDHALKQVFYYFHELTKQLNVIKLPVPRAYALIDDYALDGLVWQEGFADYRTQSQSAGAMVELVTFSYRLQGTRGLRIERGELAIERLRALLFDYGLQFSCNEYRNARRHLERAEFHIEPVVSVSARWRADFDAGIIVLETRNLERFGSLSLSLRPQAVDQALLDAFTSAVLAQPSDFRELARR